MEYTVNRRAIMINAHKIARYLKDNGNFQLYRQALSIGLKKAWAIAKGLLKPLTEDVVAWAIENFTYEEAYTCKLRQVLATYVLKGA